ncbi:MAG TPA: HD domain-containing phosphohydrolase [Gaiellaceae bacterium]|nr:HD domain-containing phosphohydrolase [Gaiellaceae bacterium]
MTAEAVQTQAQRRPIGLATSAEPLSRLVSLSRAIAAEQVSQRMLRVASRELTLLLNAEACLVSQLEDGLLREIADYARTDRQVARGLSYYLGDYPATEAVLESRVPCSISTDDAGADPAEIFVLREMEMQAVLLVPLVVEKRTWGLIEVYDSRIRAFPAPERHLAELAAAQIGGLLAAFEHEERAQRLYRETLASLSNALEAKDAVTSQHTEEVVRLAVAVAAELGIDLDGVQSVELGAVLHDIGKVRVPEAILNKPGALTEEEWEVMRTHPEVGEQILRPIQSLQSILPIVRHHHERWDGTGYPDRLAGSAIPLGARIVAVCDAYRAMTEDRPYRAALDETEARNELEQGAGAQFDPDCVQALLRALERRDAVATVVALRPPSSVETAEARK